MHSIKTDNLEIRLSAELWELFTMQAEIETLRRTGRHYAPTLDEMRQELILDAARHKMRAQAKLDLMRRLPVDVSELDQIAKLCFVASMLSTLAEKITAIAADRLENRTEFPQEILGQIDQHGDSATQALAQVFSETLLQSCSDWIKASVLADYDRQAMFQQNVAHCSGLDAEHPGVVATAQALTLLARDYQSEFDFQKVSAEMEGWEFIHLDSLIESLAS